MIAGCGSARSLTFLFGAKSTTLNRGKRAARDLREYVPNPSSWCRRRGRIAAPPRGCRVDIPRAGRCERGRIVGRELSTNPLGLYTVTEQPQFAAQGVGSRPNIRATRLHGITPVAGRGAAATRLHGITPVAGRGAAATRLRGPSTRSRGACMHNKFIETRTPGRANRLKPQSRRRSPSPGRPRASWP